LSPPQTFLSENKEYDVHAISVYDSVTFVLLVDNYGMPSFFPRMLFSVTNSKIPADWICNIFATGPIQLIIGPDFIAADLDSYNEMADQAWSKVEMLPRRIESSHEVDD